MRDERNGQRETMTSDTMTGLDEAGARTKIRIRGSLLGGAIGDALGAPVEFLSLREIRERFGNAGLRDYAPAYGQIGAITDDTQMTLFTAEGLLRAYVRSRLKGIASIASVVSHAYLRWLMTQDIEPKALGRPLEPRGFLWNVPALHSRRAPGNTCVSALLAMTAFSERRAANTSKGAGGIMRVAPVAMMFAGQPSAADEVFRLGMETAWVTHGHPSGFLSAAAFAVMLHALLCEETLQDGIARAQYFLTKEDGHDEALAALNLGVRLAAAGNPPEIALPIIGEAWVGEEALGISAYCALTAENFSSGVLVAVNHDGDSDTTGSLVGQLLGAIYGVDHIPQHWLERLELRETIEQLANDLAGHRSWNLDEYDYDEEVVARYPGG